MKVLIACEFSGIVRDAFLERGHDAISCNLLPTESFEPHYQGDVFDILYDNWNLVIAHPPCTFLCNSGVRWLYNNDKSINEARYYCMKEASQFFRRIYYSKKEKLCIENPIPHKYAHLPEYKQIIQPWMFGHGETKSTCLWLKGLPKLEPTNIVAGRESRIHKMAPSKNRSKERSKTFFGVARAMAEQWG